MPRPQFSLKMMLWLTLVVAAFFGGAAWQDKSETPIFRRIVPTTRGIGERIVMPNGDIWFRLESPERLHRRIEEAMATAAGTGLEHYLAPHTL